MPWERREEERDGCWELEGDLVLSAAAPPAQAATPAVCWQRRKARLGDLSVLSEMSAEINLANPPRWPVTLISLKFQAD